MVWVTAVEATFAFTIAFKSIQRQLAEPLELLWCGCVRSSLQPLGEVLWVCWRSWLRACQGVLRTVFLELPDSVLNTLAQSVQQLFRAIC